MVLTQTNAFDKICVSSQKPRAQRRINGLQLPLHPQQIIGWLAIVVSTTTNFMALVPTQCQQLKDPICLMFLILYLGHAISHVTALLVDPAESKLRELSRFTVPEFDRSVHAHVIENGRCHLCNTETSSKSTKHCSICNKCVAGFDHHCKWLNHCVGKRNYVPFFASVTTATIVTLLTSVISFCDVVFYYTIPSLLAAEYTRMNATESWIQQNINSTVQNSDTNWKFIASWTAYGFINLVISCVLLHLCTFHVYISLIGISTYEYIVRNIDSEASHDKTKQTIERHDHANAQPSKSIICFTKRKKWHKNKVGIYVSTESNEAVHRIRKLPNAQASDMINKTNLSITNLTTILMSGMNTKSATRLYQGNQKHQRQENEITKDFITEETVNDVD